MCSGETREAPEKRAESKAIQKERIGKTKEFTQSRKETVLAGMLWGM